MTKRTYANDALVNHIAQTINEAFDKKEQLMEMPDSDRGHLLSLVERVLDDLDKGLLKVAEKKSGVWTVNVWLKKAILLSFLLGKNKASGEGEPFVWYDKVPLKFESFECEDFFAAKIRAVPGSIVRRGAFVGENVVLMPSFVNVGASIGAGTMVYSWASVGSCAQIGKRCHISGGVGIGGVLEPLQSTPVIIEDDCFIGARSEIAEGVIVEKGSVIAMGVFIGASTKIVNRSTGEVVYGRVPAYSVVVPGVMPAIPARVGEGGELAVARPQLACAVIVKTVDEKTKAKTSINDLLRV